MGGLDLIFSGIEVRCYVSGGESFVPCEQAAHLRQIVQSLACSSFYCNKNLMKKHVFRHISYLFWKVWLMHRARE